MEVPLESAKSRKDRGTGPGWAGVGILAAASALAGGVAAAWWYKKTLRRLQEGMENGGNPHFGIENDHPDGEEG